EGHLAGPERHQGRGGASFFVAELVRVQSGGLVPMGPRPTSEVSRLQLQGPSGATHMCRNIKTLFNFEPPATQAEIRASAVQFVRKLSGFNAPSKANQAAFDRAIEEVTDAARTLMLSLTTSAEPRDRAVEAERAKARSALRFPAKK